MTKTIAINDKCVCSVLLRVGQSKDRILSITSNECFHTYSV